MKTLLQSFLFLLFISFSLSSTAQELLQITAYGSTSGVLDEAGDEISYTLELYSWPGNNAFTNVSVFGDDFVTDLAYFSGDDNTNNLLDEGENWIYKATYILTSDDIDNMGIPAGSSHIEYNLDISIEDNTTAEISTFSRTITAYIYYPDADGDGVIDDNELVDGTDPYDGCDFDIYHVSQGQTSEWYAGDCDGDGVPNEAEYYTMNFPNHDTDNDGVIDIFDIDDDNDGILTIVEGASTNSDSDVLPNYLDQDSDGDGLPDNVEAQNTFGYTAPSGVDANQDGLDDAYVSGGAMGITPRDTDGDDIPDYKDLDADNDGFFDQNENEITLLSYDMDEDGLDDASEEIILSPYTDANGIYNDPQYDLPNTDGIGDLDYRDADSTSPSTGAYPYTVAPLPYQLYGVDVPFTFNGDDDFSSIIPINFDFNFFGNDYNHLLIGDNGVITFNLSEANGYCPWAFTASVPNPSLIHNAIFGPYQDIYNVEGTGTIAYGNVGTVPFRKFVAFYENVPLYQCNELTSTNQIIIYETYNLIDVQEEERGVCDIWQNGAGAIGIQNIDGTEGYFPEDRNTGNWYATLEGYRFTPESSFDFQYILCDSDGNGTESFDFVTILNAIGYAPGYTHTFHSLMEDAENNINTLSSPYTNTSNSQNIYLRIENNTSGEIEIKSILLAAIDCAADYDLDNVATLEEDLNGNGNFGDDDTDGDNIPDFIDEDDDGDYILTNAEAVNTRTSYLDTDDDGIPNYLDNDDDGDGTLTIDEDYNGDWNPLNDDLDGDGIPDFLDVTVLGTLENEFHLFNVFPNPAKDLLTIKMDNNQGQIDVQLTNIQGQLVYKNLFSSNQIQLDITDFSPGVYFVEVKIGTINQIEKIIIE